MVATIAGHLANEKFPISPGFQIHYINRGNIVRDASLLLRLCKDYPMNTFTSPAKHVYW